MAIRDYATADLTVHWDPSICQHSRVCATTLPAVFRPRERPWIEAGASSTDELAAAIDACPSRALTYTRNAPASDPTHEGALP